MSGTTPSQTVGPFFNLGLLPLSAGMADTNFAEMIHVTGQILDGHGVPVPDSLLECWSADNDGRYLGTDEVASSTLKYLQGFLRVLVDDQGRFSFRAMRPGRVAGPDGVEQASHIVVMIFMRGLLRHLYTRIYFADDASCLSDQILSAVPAGRRRTLLAQPETNRSAHYIWNVHLQGEDETVFFAL